MDRCRRQHPGGDEYLRVPLLSPAATCEQIEIQQHGLSLKPLKYERFGGPLLSWPISPVGSNAQDRIVRELILQG
jgi:hypothetical protein